MSRDHWRVYPAIVDTAEHHADGIRPMPIIIAANVLRGALSPVRMVTGTGTVDMTLDQSRELRLTLERAERDARRGQSIEVEVDLSDLEQQP